MLKKVELEKLNDYFLELGRRKSRGAYFYRISGYNDDIRDFILKYYEASRQNGVIIEGKLKNPDNNNLSYYNEIMGMNFRLDMGFIRSSLSKWLPRMNGDQRENVAGSIYDTLDRLRKAGKNDNMLKNAYIKFMCWLYYKFERIVGALGNEKLPKILYDGEVGTYELLLLEVLCTAGADIVLLEYTGDGSYLKTDPASEKSFLYKGAGLGAFPENYSLKSIRDEIQEAANNARLYGSAPKYRAATNIWLSGDAYDDVRKDITTRGNDSSLYYNCFARINGVGDALTYPNDLYRLQLELKNSKRNVVIVSKAIAPPSPDEISQIKRGNYKNISQLVMDMCANLNYISQNDFRDIVKKAFIDMCLEENKKNGGNLNRVTNRAVYLLAWLRRYSGKLFGNWSYPELGVFLYLGGCRDENETVFFRFLASLPTDILILVPNLNIKCKLEDPRLYEMNYDTSMNLEVYPEVSEGLKASSAAYNAERDLDRLMYQDSGLYRQLQYGKANAINLQIIYEEIGILWNEELKFRGGFGTVDDVVNMPVIYAKVMGVKNKDINQYWVGIKKLLTPETTLITSVPNMTGTMNNPVKPYVTDFYKNRRLLRDVIKAHRSYQYGFLRESVQDYLLDKLQLLIEQQIIKGTFVNGTEYTILSVALNLDKEVLRTLQNFDFTKKNPKMIYVITGENTLSLEDTIYVSYLNLLGFDIVFFVPTGYQCIEKHLNKVLVQEHQYGEFVYDLQVPDFNTITDNTQKSFIGKIFKRK